MVPTPLFYQLLVVALVLICLFIHVGLPDMPLPKPQPPLASNKRRRRRSQEPQPFTGLMHKPLCEACEQGADVRPQAPGEPPPIITFTRGRRRTVVYLYAADNSYGASGPRLHAIVSSPTTDARPPAKRRPLPFHATV
jgi:hypothetical protein